MAALIVHHPPHGKGVRVTGLLRPSRHCGWGCRCWKRSATSPTPSPDSEDEGDETDLQWTVGPSPPSPHDMPCEGESATLDAMPGS